MTVTGCDHHGPSGIITKALWAPSHRSWHGGDVSLDLEKGVKNNTIRLSYIHLHPPTSFVKLVELVESQNKTHSLAGLGTIFIYFLQLGLWDMLPSKCSTRMPKVIGPMSQESVCHVLARFRITSTMGLQTCSKIQATLVAQISDCKCLWPLSGRL